MVIRIGEMSLLPSLVIYVAGVHLWPFAFFKTSMLPYLYHLKKVIQPIQSYFNEPMNKNAISILE